MSDFTLAIGGDFTEGFFSGVQSRTQEVPHRWPAALAGRGYLIDRESDQWEHRSIPLLKQQIGTDDDEVGEASINPEGAWRRATDSWHLGAGQSRRDDLDAQSQRFRSSKGINCWTRGQISLLNDTTQAHAAASTTTIPIVTTDQYAYYISGAQAIDRTDLTTTTACTGEPAAGVTSLASIGKRVYGAFGASGIYGLSSDNGTAFTAWSTTACTLLGWAKNRLIGANANVLTDHSITGAGTTLLTHSNAAFAWTAIADGVSHAYAAGNAGDKALIYRLGLKSDGSGLDVPIVAGRLPDGETIHAMYGYAGVLLIGTSLGLRVAEQSSTGDLTIGPAIEIGATVRCFAGRGRYVWFGWTNYDSTSTGTGRLDLQNFTETLVPAYASDVMVTGQGTVDGLAFLGSTLAIGVAAAGVYKPSSSLVASGTLDSGVISYGIVEDKLFVGGRRGVSGDGEVTLSISVEGDDFEEIGESGESYRGTYAELRLELERASTTSGPTVDSLTLFAYPSVTRTELLIVPFLLATNLADLNGVETHLDVAQARQEIRSLVLTGQITTYQEGAETWTVRVEDYVRIPHKNDDNETLVVRMKAL